MEIEIIDDNFAEYRIPDDYNQILPFMEVFVKNVYGKDGKFIRYNIFEIYPSELKKLFRLSKINIMYLALLEFVYNINPKNIDKYVDKSISKEKLLIFFKTIIDELPSEATIRAFQKKFMIQHTDKFSLVYWNTFGMASTEKYSSLIDLFSNVKIISQEVLQQLGSFNFDKFDYFQNIDGKWCFKYKMKDLAQIIILYAKKNKITIEADYTKRVFFLVPNYSTIKSYSERSLYEKVNFYKKDLIGLDNTLINEKKALEEFEFIFKS